MYLHYSPFHRFSDICGDFYDSESMGIWKTTPGSEVQLYSRGQWILKQFCDSVSVSRKPKRITIFIPAFFCEVALPLLRSELYRLVFFRLDSRLRPDVAHIASLSLKYGEPELLVVVHYFGFPTPLSEIKRWANERGVVILEDAAHSLLPVPGVGDNGLPVMYTPWKFLSLRQGALLVLPENFSRPPLAPDTGQTTLNDYIWLFKQGLLSFLVESLEIPLHRLRKAHIKRPDESELAYETGGSEKCTNINARLVATVGDRYHRVMRVRMENYRLMHKLLRDAGMSGLFFFQNLPDQFVPYCFPIMPGESKAYRLMIALANAGVCAQPWSDLSPEVKDNDDYLTENAWRKGIVTLPIHQNLDEHAIRKMAALLVCLFRSL